MKLTRIALLAAASMFVLSLPASAAPAVSGDAGVRTDRSDMMQVAQNATRAASEARGGDFKSKKKKTTKKKK